MRIRIFEGWLTGLVVLGTAIGVREPVFPSAADAQNEPSSEHRARCHAATPLLGSESVVFEEGDQRTTVVVEQHGTCERKYVLTTTARLRDNEPSNPRTILEQEDSPTLRTGNVLFDALYALAIDEARENSVESIRDASFNHGEPLSCGGCFQTGRLWTYVWTRDTAYASDLALASLDPSRARRSLEFKTSRRRGGTDLQIVQDTGSGGSYPISTDRVVWALGAWEVLKFLDGDERRAFAQLAYEAIKNTAEHDRAVIFDSSDGLYRGETSFLDWREQSYPSWTRGDVLAIGTSKALSTNVAHLALLEIGSRLATEHREGDASARFRDWATALRRAIADRFSPLDDGRLPSFILSPEDPAPSSRSDLLGTALAVLMDIGPGSVQREALAAYPWLSYGPPVTWPEERALDIYHNRTVWPFVTAYAMRAARRVRNDAIVDSGTKSLVRGAALTLTNMESFDAVSGRTWFDDGTQSGPVINSQRQLWSVAGYLSMVQDVLFGLEASQDGIRFVPFIPRSVRTSWFAASSRLVLNGFVYKRKRIHVVIEFPRERTSGAGAYVVKETRLNGRAIGGRFVRAGELRANNLFRIVLSEPLPDSRERLTNFVDVEGIYAPSPLPAARVARSGADVIVRLAPSRDVQTEPEIVGTRIFRDGVERVTLPRGARSYRDPESGVDGRAHCYTMETVVAGSCCSTPPPTINASHRTRPVCLQAAGLSPERVFSVENMLVKGGRRGRLLGRVVVEGWGADADELRLQRFEAPADGQFRVQLVAINRSGPVNTGITCAVKRIDVHEVGSADPVGSGYVLVPHSVPRAWNDHTVSSSIDVDLRRGHVYEIRVYEDARAINMSDFAHFDRYTGGIGGMNGPRNEIAVHGISVMQVEVAR